MFFLKDLPTREILQRYAARYPDMDVEKTDTALHMLRWASQLLRDLEAYFMKHGLSQTRFLILIVLDREPERDRFTVSDLVARLDVSKPVITTTLQALQRHGLVRIASSEEDRRSKHIEITEQGRAKLEEVLPGYYRLINQSMDGKR